MKVKYMEFECCRCMYKTSEKSRMHYHLYIRRTPCPAARRDITLTEEIKDKIMIDRIYRPPEVPSTTANNTNQLLANTPVVPNIINNTIYNHQNIHNIMNVIAPQMSHMERLMTFCEYKDKDMVSLCDNVEELFKEDTRKLQNDEYMYGFDLTIDDLLEVMNRISQSKDADYRDMNIIFDSKENKINVLDDTNEWSESLVDKGLKVILENIQDGYLHEYERYLVKKIESSSGQSQQQFKERLIVYYNFIACFDRPPLCSEDCMSQFDSFITHRIIDQYYPIYKKSKDTVKKAEKNHMRKAMIDILKRNSDKNMKNLYTNFYELFAKNTDFQHFLLSKRQDDSKSIDV